MSAPWPAPRARGPLSATVSLPGSKSLTARYLVLAALAEGPSRLTGVLDARDSRLMERALGVFGARFNHTAPDAVEVVPAARRLGAQHRSPDAAAAVPAAGAPRAAAGGASGIDVGLAGTVMRFLAPVAALAEGRFTFDGDRAAAARPIRPLLAALGGLGADVGWPPEGESLPFTITGRGRLRGGRARLDTRASSQFLSALLLAAPRFEDGLRVELSPPSLPSRPHVDMTIRALNEFGARARATGEWSWEVAPGGLAGRHLAVEPDLSNAAAFLAAALVAGGEVRVPGWPGRTDQPGDRLRDHLRAFGAAVDWRPLGEAAPGGPAPAGAGVLTVSAEAGRIGGVDLDLGAAGELTPVLAALAALASAPSRLRGIGHLRGHETDRLAALTAEINRLGGDARELPDGLEIRPRPLRGALVRTYGDHRLAAFGALIGLATPGVEVEDVAVTAKTLPAFTGLWQAMVAA
ncbi:MAG: 3-phosphoshikimate 1-carboxyvinyltransferase [Bifidobacteriaceae bacterium]|nr:3-phosphoshikimate 1-carboxyvinyltransferase [Bifidobacteriaceae bacterium]